MALNEGNSGRFASIIGTFLLIEGMLGFSSPVVFGVFSTNRLHACIHIVLGCIGLFTRFRGGTRTFALLVGILLIAVGVLYFIPGVSALIVSLLNVNTAVAVFNIVVGIVGVVVARTTPEPTPIGA